MEKKGASIRRATPEEHTILTQIAHAAKRHWRYPEQWMTWWRNDLTLTPTFIANHQVYLTVCDNRAVGFYALSTQGDNLSLEHLWVIPEYIGQGVGKALFEHAVQQGISLNARTMEIVADPHAEGFYNHLGAQRVGEIPSLIPGRSLPRLFFSLLGKTRSSAIK